MMMPFILEFFVFGLLMGFYLGIHIPRHNDY